MASAISGFINAIRNAVYGEEVRGAIISALEQCYSDVNAPSLQTEAFETALNEAYAGGILDIQTVTTIAAMTNDKIIYRYNGTETGKQKGLYYYSALSESWVLIGSEIHAVSLAAQMTDTNAIYKYTGSETGYNRNTLYYYNGTEWSNISQPTVTSFTQENSGKPADAYAVGMALNGIEGISTPIKDALLACFQNVAWSNTLGQTLYSNLRAALYPDAPIDIGYVTTGLFALWDGINNTGAGHDSSIKTWTDLVGGRVFSPYASSNTFSFDENSLSFAPTASGSTSANGNALVCPNFGAPKTIEVVFSPSSLPASAVIAILTGELTDVDGMKYIAFVKGTNTLIVHKGANGCFDLPSDPLTVRSVSVVYGDNGIAAYINGTAATPNSNQEYFSNGVGYTNNVLGSSPSWAFRGNIYSVRMYNTELTAAEIAANYAVDVERFNLEA